MSSKGKRRDEESGDSDSDNVPPPKKKAIRKRRKDYNDSDDVVICELSKDKRVSVRTWQGKVVVDIRVFYMKDDKAFPSKKGITLFMDQWKILAAHVSEIDKAFAGDA